MKNVDDKIQQNIAALSATYKKELLDFTFTLLEKQERESRFNKDKEASDRNKEILAKIKDQIKEEKAEQDTLREIWRKS